MGLFIIKFCCSTQRCHPLTVRWRQLIFGGRARWPQPAVGLGAARFAPADEPLNRFDNCLNLNQNDPDDFLFL